LKPAEKAEPTPPPVDQQQEKVRINFAVGDRVKIKEGTFENFEGAVARIDETNGQVTVSINIFGRITPVVVQYWQIEASR
jgi:transcriptional antiterminator NusG